jgi:hypothetical protein
MSYEFLAKNGLISQGNVTVTGSLITSQNVTASNISVSATGSFGVVGIGTTIPTQKLSLATGGNLSFQNTLGATGNYGAIYSYNDLVNTTTPATAIRFIRDISNIGPDGAIAFDTNNTERIRVTSANGYVGIGTTTPNNKLHVYNSAGSSTTASNAIAIFEQSSNAGIQVCVPDASEAGLFFSRNGAAYYSAITRNGTDLLLKNNSTTAVTINSSGNVGIGTTSVNFKLDIWGATGTTLNMANVDDSGRGGKLTFISSSAAGRQFFVGTNSSIYNLVFGIDSIEKMRLDTNGNVGIGTTNPSSRLHISGSSATAITITDDVLYTNSISNDNSVMTYTVDTGNAAAASAAHVFKRFNTELVRIDPSGDVGIGTSVPGALLDVSYGDYQNAGTIRMGADLGTNTSRTNATRKWGLITGYNYTNASAAIPIIGYDSANTYNAINIGGGTSAIAASPTYISFYTTSSLSTYGTERVRIDSSGNVGIGTLTPSTKLAVEGGSVSTVNITGSDVRYSFDIRTLVGGAIGFNNAAASNVYGAVTGSAYFGVAQSYPIVFTTAGTERMRIESGGNVGIGTTNPTSKLNVSGSTGGVFEVDTAGGVTSLYVSASGDVGIGTTAPTTQTNYRFLSVNSSAAGSSVIETLVNGVRIGGMEADSSNFYLESIGSYPIVFRTAVNEKMRITAAGNVGIGTSSPAQKLEIQSGSVLLRGDGSALFGTYYASAGENTFFTLHSGSGNTFHIGNDVAGTNYNTIVLSAATDSTGGKVGIGTSNPGSKLQINDNTPTLTIRANDGGTSRKAYIDFYTTFFNYPSDVGARRTSTIVTGFDSGVWGTEFLAFNVGSGSANDAALLPIERVRIDGSGNVGIGTTVPTARLHVSGSTGGVFEVDTAGGATTFYVSASGNVGIGTTNPVAKLHVIGNISGSSFTSSVSNAVGFLGTSSWAQNVVSASYATTAQTANALNASNNYQVNSIGVGIAGSGTAGRIGMNEAGIRSWSITPTGGRLVIEAGDGLGSAIFACPLTSSNFVGPGTGLTGTAASLTAGTANALNASNTYTVAGLTSAYVDVNGSGTIPTTGIYRPSTKTLGLSADGTLIFKISNVSSPATSSIETGNFLVQSGNVGIGTANATDKLTVYGALASYKNGADTIQTQVYLANAANTRAFNVQLNSGGTGLDLWSYNSANAWLRHTTFDYDGRVGIGTAAPVAKFEISGSSNSALMNIKSPISGAILYVSGSGAVGIGTSNVGAYTLQVNGSFGATTKSFVIDHPTKEGKKLIYGSLESPYHGIRLTGRDTLKEGKCKIQLPDYIYKLILHDSVNIQLTGIKCNKTLYVDDINVPENYFTIAYDKAMFETYKDYDFFWDFTAIRSDVPELITEL